MALVTQVANSAAWSGGERQRRATAADGRNTIQSAGKQSDLAGPAASFVTPARRSAVVSRIVEAEILPRLALVRSSPAASAIGVTAEHDTSELVGMLMGREDEAAWRFVQDLEQHGVSPAALYLGIVTDAARRLGELWEDDRTDFATVTIGLGRLQRIVRALSPGFQVSAVARSAHADTILLLPAPGEQHTLGLVILSEFFHREGWHMLGGPVSTGQTPAATVRDTWVDVAGFSLGSITHLHALTACIRAVRKASRNPCLAVMVGGPLFLQRPELVNAVGADSTAADAANAVRQARGFLSLRAAAE